MFKADVVLKAGGAALADAAGIVNFAKIAAQAIRKHEGRVAIVVSAMKGVTDELLTVARNTPRRTYRGKEVKQTHFGYFSFLRARHFAVARQFGVAANLIPIFRELNQALCLVREPQSDTTLTTQTEMEDLMASFGERLAAPLVAAAINQELGAQTAQAVDARNLIVAHDALDVAKVDLTETEQKFARFFANFEGVSVITGFIGATRDGQVITLGRNGSDLSAAIVLRILCAKTLELWKTVDGVMTADPTLVPLARLVSEISFEEMFKISGCGAKVIDPRTMFLAREAGADIWIKNVYKPDGYGTRISGERRVSGKPVSCIVVVPDVVALDVEGVGLANVPGMLERVAGATRHQGVDIKFVAQPVSQGAISLAVKSDDAAKALNAFAAEFGYEIDRGTISVSQRGGKLGAIAIIGDRMRGVCGITWAASGALARAQVNLVGYAQAANEEDISVLVAEADLKAAVNALHREFFADGDVGVFIVGLGNVGTEFARKFALAHVPGAKLVGVANSKQRRVDLNGIDGEEAKQLLSASGEPFSVDKLIEASRNFKQVVVVDCTSSEEIARQYVVLAEAGIHIVRANKKLSALSMEDYERFARVRARTGALERKSACVGAGLPFLQGIACLKRGNDVIIHIEAILSATNNFVLDESGLMRENLRKAEELGYAEPRKSADALSVDLTGEDVRMKIVEVLRTMGWWIEANRVDVEDLNKHSDEEIQQRKQLAQEHGYVLKYVATVDVGVLDVRVSVGLREVGIASPLASVHGACNGMVVYTRIYERKPIVITGQGAGVEQTAQALLADLVDVVDTIKNRR